ncbi:MAG: homocysteine S-methyltransferase family protein [Rhodospirillaceae bacterium]|nr:homocysteine S-methyltransferase family protein [Rhodospirillaceae bacterium]
MADRLSAKLARHRMVLVDGGVVDGLHALGLPLGEPPEAWCLDRPEAVLDVHRGLAAAGAEIVTTNSVGANHGRYGDEAEAICAASVRLARIAAPDAAIAGAIGPTGSPFERRFLFTGQAAALASAGADLLWFEALADAGDASAAFEAARPSGIPYVLTFDPRPVLGDHEAAQRFVELVASASRFDPRPIAIGVDSGLGPELALKALGAIGALDIPLVVRANAGLPELKGGALVRPFGVEEMTGYAIVARRLGARIVGGFGGVDSTLLAAIADAL